MPLSLSDDAAEVPDASLVQAAKAGDEQALETLLLRHTPLVRAKARAFFILGAEHEDLVQEGMIGLFKAIRDYDRTRGSFSSFAQLCVSRQIITAIKSATRQKHLPLNGYVSLNRPIFSDEPERRLEDTLPALSPGPDEILLSNEYVREFHSRVSKSLSPFELQVLALHLEGISYDMIARNLNRPFKSVDNAVWRVRRKLRRAIMDKGA